MKHQTTPTLVKTRNLLWSAPLAGLIAALLNLTLFLLFSRMNIISDSIIIPGQGPITVAPVLFSSFIPALLAGLVLTLLTRFTKKPFTIFRTLTLVLLVISFINPFLGIPGITIGMGIALNIMHIVVAATVVYVFEKYARQ